MRIETSAPSPKPTRRPSLRARRTLLWSGVSALTLLLTVLLGVGLGSTALGPLEVLRALLGGPNGSTSGVIVWELRLPRVAMGLLVGASLAVSGAAYQSLFRNPLADPYLMGAASGGVLGATLALLWGLSSALVPPFTFLFAGSSVALTLLLARQGRGFPPLRLVLAGVVVGSVATALSTYVLLGAGDRVREVYAWTLGHLTFSGWRECAQILPYAAGGALVLWTLSRSLNTLELGEATAFSLGIPVERLRMVTILAATLTTAAAVSYVGVIGFVGLVTPHLLRRLVGADLRVLLPACALGGSVLLSLADTLARTLVRPQELPIGVVTTLLGGPFFLYLLRKQR